MPRCWLWKRFSPRCPPRWSPHPGCLARRRRESAAAIQRKRKWLGRRAARVYIRAEPLPAAAASSQQFEQAMTNAGRASAALVLAGSLAATASVQHVAGDLPVVQANENRVAAGSRRHDTLDLHLVVQMADWRPESDTGPSVAVAAFSEEGKAPQIPAPLIRVSEGMVIAASVHNALTDSTIGVVGLVDHPTTKRDTLFVRPGETKTVRFAAGMQGTYLYHAIIGAHLPGDTLHEREQAAGAFVVDPRGGAARDRIFVINIWGEQTTPTSYSNALAINGHSWPWTERLDAVVGDT